MLVGKPIHEITENDLQNLIGKPEDNNLEFKKILPNPQTGKTEFLVDVSAFANAGGGHIIYGMDEEDLKAAELCGLGAINVEKEVQRLQNWTNEGIEPRIPGLRIRPIDLSGKAVTAIVIHIPHSFAAPHQIKDTRRFHSRYSIGKDGMNVAELRAAFNLSENLENRIKTFRKERADILSSDDAEEEIPVILIPGIRLVMHIIPLSFLDIGQIIDLSTFQFTSNPAQWIMEHHMNYGRFNLEGFVRPDGIENKDGSTQLRGYTQVYRNGVIEAVDTVYEKDQLLYLPSIEGASLRLFKRSLAIEENLGVVTPLVLMLTLLGVKNCRFEIPDHFTGGTQSSLPMSKNKLLIPDIVIEDYEQPHRDLMKYVFDMLWNAGGWERSFSYDENGAWKRNY